MSVMAQTMLPAMAPYHAALRQAGRGDIGGALGSLERLIEADPTYAPAYRRYAGLADATGQGGRVDAFLQTMAAGSVYGHYGLAVAAANRGNAAGVVLGHIEPVIRARPDFLPGLLVWNRTLLRLKQIDQGLDYYRVRAQDDVTRFAAHHLRAWSSGRSVDDLEQLAAISRTHRHRREFTEAWLLAEYARFSTHHRALEAVRQVSGFAAEAGDDDLGNYAASLGADLLYHSGAVRDAAVLAERVAATSRELGDHAAEVDMLYRLCMARRTLGDLAEARRSCAECVRRGEATTKPASTLSDAWASLAWIDISAGDMQAGLASLKTAAAWATSSSFPTLPAIRRLDLAEALFQLGQRSEAEAAARRELALFEKSGSQTEVLLNGLLARCLAARGDAAGARLLFAKATDAARQSGNHLLEQQLLTEAGLAALAAGQTVEARESLILALAKAREHEDARSLQALLTGLGPRGAASGRSRRGSGPIRRSAPNRGRLVVGGRLRAWTGGRARRRACRRSASLP